MSFFAARFCLVATLLLGCSPSTSSTAVPPAAGTGTAPTSPTAVASGTSGEAEGAASTAAGSTDAPEIKESDCPPRCSESGAWVGCGLEKPRGKSCGGCVPKCKSKGSAEEGWYDCTGVFIATAKCAG